MNWFNTKKCHFLLGGIIGIIPFFGLAQQHNLPLNQSLHSNFERALLQSDQIIHHSFQPVLLSEAKRSGASVEHISPVLFQPDRSEKSFVARKLFHEHLINLDTGIFQLTIDPIVNFERSFDSEDTRDITLFKNTRGFILRASLGDKVSIASTFRENQANLPHYQSIYTHISGVAYGQGRTKVFKENGFDFAMASSYVSYSPSERINIQTGQGKHFIGNGHRSLLLSDVAFNYPYLKINTNWLDHKLQYQNLFALFQDLNRLPSLGTEGLFERKQAAFHYLEYSPNNKFSIGLFEGVIFPSLAFNGQIDVGLNYWLPIIFLNTLIEGSDRGGNTNVGLNATYQLYNKVLLYNQISILDEQLKHANLQVGAKWFPHQNWMVQAEFNSMTQLPQDFIYSHYNESITFPFQQKASEVSTIIQFQKNRWLSRAQANVIMAEANDLQFVDLRQSFIVNPSYNLTFNLGFQLRNLELNSNLPTLSSPNASIIYVGLSTNLQNLYFNY